LLWVQHADTRIPTHGEGDGLIVEAGNSVVRRAAQDCQHWLEAGLAPVAGLDIEITAGILAEEGVEGVPLSG
jgi:hypothetical protein